MDYMHGDVAVLKDRTAQANGLRHAEATGTAMGKTLQKSAPYAIVAAIVALITFLVDKLS